MESVENAIESIAKWLSCNGEPWGVGPTAVFSSAAALFLYSELQATLVLGAGDREPSITILESTLVTTMIMGMLALMIHLWVCSMRFFQYYLDTLIRDSPNIILEMTTAGLFGTQSPSVALAPLTRFLRQQQPQIHITVCWFLSLCYADYVRKNYCRHFNMPYLEQWQAEVHERAMRGVNKTIAKVNSFVGALQQRLRAAVQSPAATAATDTVNHTSSSTAGKHISASEVCLRMHTEACDITTDAYERLKAYIKATRCSCAGTDANKSGACTSQADRRDTREVHFNALKNLYNIDTILPTKSTAEDDYSDDKPIANEDAATLKGPNE